MSSKRATRVGLQVACQSGAAYGPGLARRPERFAANASGTELAVGDMLPSQEKTCPTNLVTLRPTKLEPNDRSEPDE